MYSIDYTEFAAKQIRKLPKDVQARILTAVERIRVRPYSYVKKLAGNDNYKLRVGDYRIIVDIFDEKLLILVVKAGHRQNIYG